MELWISKEWRIRSTTQETQRVKLEIVGRVAQLINVKSIHDDEDGFGFHLALDEALANAKGHGNGEDSEKEILVQCSIGGDGVVQVHIADEGNGFDPAAVPDPTLEENLEKPRGRGVMLMRAYTDKGDGLQFSGGERKKGSCVELRKTFRALAKKACVPAGAEGRIA